MEPFTIIFTLVAIIVAAYYYFTRGYNLFKEHGIPHIPPVPMFGNTWLLRYTPFAQWLQDLYNIHPEAKYVGVYDLMTPVVLVRDPELIRSIAVKNFDHFVNHRVFVEEHIDPLFGKNLFSLHDDRWREVRASLTPAFTSSKLKAMFKLMSECAMYYGDYFITIPKENQVVDMKDIITRYTNDVIATCAFGIKLDSIRDRDNKFYVYGREATVFGTIASMKFFLIRSMPMLTNLLGMKLIRTEIAQFFKSLVESTIKAREERGIVRPDMIQIMMETKNKVGHNPKFTLEDMTAHAFGFFFGGFESTSSTMCFAIHEIAVNPEVQEKLQEEIDQVLEDSDGEVTYEQINNMNYLEWIVNEALRMYPVTPSTDRLCTKDFELPPALPGMKPFNLKAGSVVWFSQYGMQRDPKYFEEPTKFNPERFRDDPKKHLNSAYFIPFGMGPRMCIGNRFALLETKALLFHLFARCKLEPCEKTSVPMKLSKKGVTVRPENGFWLKIQPRKNIHPAFMPKAMNAGATH